MAPRGRVNTKIKKVIIRRHKGGKEYFGEEEEFLVKPTKTSTHLHFRKEEGLNFHSISQNHDDVAKPHEGPLAEKPKGGL